ncbi:MAG: hypothetical protein CMG21_00740 [Candidatus Marinimicrobia bacterium]|nr:hypothetical protein [Candidatus Neomarinimicrobiota bacterium]
MNDLIDSQTQKIKNLESKNKLQSDKLDNYEFTIEKNINDNRQSLKSLNNQLKENQKRSDKIVKVLFDTKGLSDETRKVGSGGVDSIKSDKPLDNSSLNKLYDQSRLLSKKVNKIQRQINLEEVYISKIEDRFYSNIKYWKAKPSRMPLNIKRGIYISSYYGYRDDPLDGNRRFHAGDDYSANREKVKDWIGTPVKATADGVVSKAHFDNRFGNYIEIDHGYGYKTVYAHLNNISVKKGEKVHRGQEIGGVGNTGRSTAAHLHYEVKRNNKTLDPRQFYTYNYKLEDLVYYR